MDDPPPFPCSWESQITPFSTPTTPTLLQFFSNTLLTSDLYRALPDTIYRQSAHQETSQIQQEFNVNIQHYDYKKCIQKLAHKIGFTALRKRFHFSENHFLDCGEYTSMYVIPVLFPVAHHLHSASAYKLLYKGQASQQSVEYLKPHTHNVNTFKQILHRLMDTTVQKYNERRLQFIRSTGYDNILPDSFEELCYSFTMHSWYTPVGTLIKNALCKLEKMLHYNSSPDLFYHFLDLTVDDIVTAFKSKVDRGFVITSTFHQLQGRQFLSNQTLQGDPADFPPIPFINLPPHPPPNNSIFMRARQSITNQPNYQSDPFTGWKHPVFSDSGINTQPWIPTEADLPGLQAVQELLPSSLYNSMQSEISNTDNSGDSKTVYFGFNSSPGIEPPHSHIMAADFLFTTVTISSQRPDCSAPKPEHYSTMPDFVLMNALISPDSEQAIALKYE
jgi:hypothetical protein